MRRIFVFGSNLSGVHGKGAAQVAEFKHGAARGVGVGLWGDSYAIPTKDCSIQTLPLWRVELYIRQFLVFTSLFIEQPVVFEVTRVGCGLAGFTDEQIAPLFNPEISGLPNCEFDLAWKPWLPPDTKFWGTF